jgi:hypothetical protein
VRVAGEARKLCVGGFSVTNRWCAIAAAPGRDRDARTAAAGVPVAGGFVVTGCLAVTGDCYCWCVMAAVLQAHPADAGVPVVGGVHALRVAT